MSSTIKNIVIPDVIIPEGLPGAGRGDLLIRDGIVAALRPGPEGTAPRCVIPALVEAHCHLDKCHTIDRMTRIGGDLVAAITAQRQDKVNWSADDLRHRMRCGLRELRDAGCALVRSHIDWSETATPPVAWSVLGELATDSGLTVDRAALINMAMLADPTLNRDLARQVARMGGTLGTFVFDQPERRAGVRAAFDLAERFGLMLDFHVDEGLAEGLNGLELIADVALETGFQGPVLCGHACSLMNHRDPALSRLLDKIAASGVFVAALLTSNLYLQGRDSGTPDRRGITRLRELRNAGVPVVIGSDNVADAFCPVGQHDPMAALHLAILTAHLDPPLERWLPAITTNAARALGREPTEVIGASVADLRISDAATPSELISGRAGRLRPLLPDAGAVAA